MTTPTFTLRCVIPDVLGSPVTHARITIGSTADVATIAYPGELRPVGSTHDVPGGVRDFVLPQTTNTEANPTTHQWVITGVATVEATGSIPFGPIYVERTTSGVVNLSEFVNAPPTPPTWRDDFRDEMNQLAEDAEDAAIAAAHAAAPPAVAAAVAANPGLGIAATRGRFPVMSITTAGGAAITSKETYVTAEYVITGTDTGVLHAGGLRIRGRGNSTWLERPKKPYRLNFDTATAPLGMTASQRNWALLANDFDPAKVGNHFALTLGAASPGLAWTPEYRIVEVVLNGTFLGVYQLADLVRMEAGRVEGEEPDDDDGEGVTGDYLLEVSCKEGPGQPAATGEPGWFTPRGVWIFYDTPSEPTEAQADYIANYLAGFESALFSSNFTDPDLGWRPYVDEESFADWFLINELTGNGDSSLWSSCKMHKPRGEKLRMGPLWDFDLSLGALGGSPTGWYCRAGTNSWFIRLYQDAGFRATLATRWADLLDRFESIGGLAFFDRLIDSEADAIARDDRRWSRTSYTPALAHTRKAWLSTRIAWLDAQLTADPSPFSATFTTTF